MNSLRPYSQSIGRTWTDTKTFGSFHRDQNHRGSIIVGNSDTGSTSCVQGFHAKTSQTQGDKLDLKGPGQGYSTKSFAWLEHSSQGRFC
jgi:hypothetical protein